MYLFSFVANTLNEVLSCIKKMYIYVVHVHLSLKGERIFAYMYSFLKLINSFKTHLYSLIIVFQFTRHFLLYGPEKFHFISTTYSFCCPRVRIKTLKHRSHFLRVICHFGRKVRDVVIF